jgi:hypothetical protein
VGILKPKGRQPVGNPERRGIVGWRATQPWSKDLGEGQKKKPHPRALEALFPNASHRLQIDRFLSADSLHPGSQAKAQRQSREEKKTTDTGRNGALTHGDL